MSAPSTLASSYAGAQALAAADARTRAGSAAGTEPPPPAPAAALAREQEENYPAVRLRLRMPHLDDDDDNDDSMEVEERNSDGESLDNDAKDGAEERRLADSGRVSEQRGRRLGANQTRKSGCRTKCSCVCRWLRSTPGPANRWKLVSNDMKAAGYDRVPERCRHFHRVEKASRSSRRRATQARTRRSAAAPFAEDEAGPPVHHAGRAVDPKRVAGRARGSSARAQRGRCRR